MTQLVPQDSAALLQADAASLVDRAELERQVQEIDRSVARRTSAT